jgi:hypothetical protein
MKLTYYNEKVNLHILRKVIFMEIICQLTSTEYRVYDLELVFHIF